MKTILFHGQAGSGKDTQVEMLLREFQVERIATGDMFRTMKSEGNEFAIELSKKIDKGVWPTPEETYTLFEQWLKRFDPTKDWILVSVARYADQIPYLDKVLEKYNRPLDMVVHFQLDEQTALDRLTGRTICPKCQSTYHPKFKIEKVKGVCDKCGSTLVARDDDNAESIKKRFEQYSNTIQPWIEVYNSRGILIEIDASGSIKDIHKEVIKNIKLK